MTVLWGPGRFLPVIASSIAASVSALSPYGLDGSNGKPPRRLDANTNMWMGLLGDVSMDVVPLIGQFRQLPGALYQYHRCRPHPYRSRKLLSSICVKVQRGIA